MRILFAIKSLDHPHGGAEKVLTDISAMFANRGHDISIITFDKPDGNSLYPLHKKINRISLGIGKPDKKTNIREIICRIFALRRAIIKNKPDIVIAFMHSMFIPAAFSLIGTNLPIIASEHTVPQYYQNRKFEFRLLCLSRFMVKTITVLSKSVKQLYPPQLQKHMSIIPNPVLANIHIDAAKTYADKTRKIILNISRFDEKKDQKTLIAAFARIADKYPQWDLRIIGEGALRPDLESQIHALGLNNRITLPGTTQEIEKEYAQANLFAIPSRFEAFGLVTAEAMTFGIPAVGFANCPGTNEIIINQENGLLVEGENRVQALANGIEILIKDDKLRNKMGIAARNSVKRYSNEHVFKKWEALIKKFVR